MTSWLKAGPKESEETATDIDPGAMGVLIDHSQDIHSDAMASTVEALDEIVETGAEVRAHGELDPEESRQAAARRSRLMTGAAFGGGMLAAAGIGGALQALFASPAFAASATDVQILQTAASIRHWPWPPTRRPSPFRSSAGHRPIRW